METLPLVKMVKDVRGHRRWYIKVNDSAKWEKIRKWWVDVALRNRMVTQLENKDGLASESDL